MSCIAGIREGISPLLENAAGKKAIKLREWNIKMGEMYMYWTISDRDWTWSWLGESEWGCWEKWPWILEHRWYFTQRCAEPVMNYITWQWIWVDLRYSIYIYLQDVDTSSAVSVSQNRRDISNIGDISFKRAELWLQVRQATINGASATVICVFRVLCICILCVLHVAYVICAVCLTTCVNVLWYSRCCLR